MIEWLVHLLVFIGVVYIVGFVPTFVWGLVNFTHGSWDMRILVSILAAVVWPAVWWEGKK